jgi:hypothetical protein
MTAQDLYLGINEFLRQVLGNGPVPTTDIEGRAREAGLLREKQSITNSKLFKSAKQSLGIRSVRTGFGADGGWSWQLDEAVKQPVAVLVSKPEAVVAPEQHPAEAHPLFLWAEGVARLDHNTAPADVPLHRWSQFVADCQNFMAAPENWVERAYELGWSGLDLFGCHRDRPLMYLSAAGLVWAINGGRLLSLYLDGAVIEVPRGGQRVYHRRRQDPTSIILPWKVRRRAMAR